MTLDANIIIAYLAGDSTVIETILGWKREGRTLFLSSVVETEVLSFSGWSPQELAEAQQFLKENFTPISFDHTLALIAAEIRRSVKVKFPDAAIAATAIFTRSQLVTRNLHDFKKIPNLFLTTL